MHLNQSALMAAANNADLHAAVFDAHGLEFDRLPHAFVAHDTPPSFYAHMICTTANAPDVMTTVSNVCARFAGQIAVKDSFKLIDPDHFGLRVLFDASWIWRDAQECQTDWRPVETAKHRAMWEVAWSSVGAASGNRIFPNALIGRSDFVFFAEFEGDKIRAGCIANVSDDCVGVSNVFSVDPSVDTFERAAAAVQSVAKGKPVVGYEAGDDLAFANAAGFESVGDLRVLVPALAQG